MKRHRKYAALAAMLLAVGVATETSRLVLHAPWPGFATWISNLVSVTFGSLWALTALMLLGRNRSRPVAHVAWSCTFVAPLVMLAHGIVTHVAGSSIGVGYVVIAVLLAACLKGAWDRGAQFSSRPDAASAHARSDSQHAS
jgi:hypothetical protein